MDYPSRLTLLFVTLFSLSMGVIAQTPTKEQLQEVEEARKLVKQMKGEQFPAFDLLTMDGNRYTSENTKGKVILFNFWFTSCRPCIEEMPELNDLVAEYATEDILFLAPTFNDSTLIQKFLTRFTFDYQIVPDQREFCIEMNVRNFPTHFIINREGTVEKVLTGYSDATVGTLRKSLNKMLKSD